MNKKFLDILFDEEDEVCISNSQFAYKSVPKSSLDRNFLQIQPNNDSFYPISISPADIQLISINPIKGARLDQNVTKFRSFLVELDFGLLQEQMNYIENLNMPYSACVFSGNKSLHYAITLKEDLPDEGTYRLMAEWILNIVDKADQNTKNPSRGIRFAGNIRKETDKLMAAAYLGDRIEYSELVNWLNTFPDKDPRLNKKSLNNNIVPTLNGIPVWVWNSLKNGIDTSNGRNKAWFGIFMEFAKVGYGLEDMVNILEDYFIPERDFRTSEWKNIAKSAIKTSERRNG